MPASILKSLKLQKEKMASYILSNKAVEDLSTIWNYSFEAWSEKQADKYYYMLLDFCQDLVDGKILGKHYPEIDLELFGCRAVQPIVFYKKTNNRIEIIRILHSRMDLKNRIQE